MKCPYCGSGELKVVDKRDTPDFDSIRRRRECLKCHNRFTTFERIESIELEVEKKDGRIEPFSREKLRAGIITACQKRPVSLEDIEKVVDKIVSEVKRASPSVVKSRALGKAVTRQLKRMDKVAYLRFISVYKDFDDIDSFRKEISMMNKNGGKEKWLL